MTDPNPHEESGEGNLRDLDDDTYFRSLEEFPGAVDERGEPVVGLFDDVVDARESKRRAREAAGRGNA